MKNIKYIVLATLTLSFAGCKKFLNQEPITQVSQDFVFSDVENTRRAIAGVYSRLAGDQGYGIRLSLYYTVDNDETQGPGGAANDNDRRDMSRYTLTANNAQLERPFNQIFKGIEFANICIEEIPKSPVYTDGSEKQKAQMKRMLGEALTLRAQYYFEAIRNWGDLPAHFSSAAAQAVANSFPRRVGTDTLYDRIIEDLKTAASLMPWRNEVAGIGDDIDERISKGTAKALRARIALFRGGYSLRQTSKQMERSADYLKYYQIARDECKEIMDAGQHTLNPSYKSLWKDQVCAHAIADPNGELMFQVSGIGLGGSNDTKLGYYNGPSVNGKGNKSINILPTYFYLFDSTDLRRDVTIAPYSVLADGAKKAGTAITAMVDGKYRRDWVSNPTIAPGSDQQYLGLKWQIIRYSDVLLMFAEAENELSGPTAAAYDAVNMVIRRGHGKPINSADAAVDLSSGLSKDNFFKALVDERSRELGAEGIRKFDLIRWNLLAAKIAKTKSWLSSLAATEPILPSDLGPYGGLVTVPKAMYYITNTTADDKAIWVNSFYVAAPSSTPVGTTKTRWFDVNTTSGGFDVVDVVIAPSSPAPRYAAGFIPNKSELLPIPQTALNANFNLTQNPKY